MSQPNIDYIMEMTKEYLDGKMELFAYELDLPYELEQRYQKMRREDPDYCELIYEELYEEGVCVATQMSESEFKKLLRKKYNRIKKIAREGFW